MRAEFFRTYLVDQDQPWWHNRWVCWWGRKPKPRQTEKGVDKGDHPHTLRLEWRLFSRSNNASVIAKVGAEDGHEVTVAVGIPWLLSFYVTHSVSDRFTKRVLPWYQSSEEIGWSLDREVWLYWHRWRVNVSLWVHSLDHNYGDYGRTPIPKWRSFSFSVNPLDFFGPMRCETKILEEERPVLIPMPEGEYGALLKVEKRTWTRKLWPWWPIKREQTTRDITCPDGIPFSGKGENSWDCGEDGLYGTGFATRSDEEACALFAASALQTRRKRGDPRVWPESPGGRRARIAILRAEREDREDEAIEQNPKASPE